jgi:hypothetical protein
MNYNATYSRSFPTECQLGGRLMDGMGHAGQRTASSPGEVPWIPVELYDRPPRFAILMWRHMRSDRKNALYRSFKNTQLVN